MGAGGVRAIRVLDARGGFGAPRRVGWRDGVFALDGLPQADDLDGSGLWLIPGLVDAHLHASWHAFGASEREELDAARTRELTAAGLRRTLAAGFTSARDAGGLDPAELSGIPETERPRIQCAVTLIDRTVADAAGGIGRAVEQALAAGARWVKLVATGGVATAGGSGLDPVFTAAEMRAAVRLAEGAGAGVMVHAWGGEAIDDAVEAGAMSLEHGIFLTDAQAERAAERGVTLVPTLRIYRLVRRMIDRGELPATLRARLDEATGAHPRAVQRARDAGLSIALGTDSGTPQQHGSNAREFDALVSAGLTPGEALLAATRSGAELLGRVAMRSGAPAPSPASAGTVVDGAPADAVILRRDPRLPGALADPDAIAAVVLAGRVLDPAVLRT
ncbi:hypothetical protein B4915_10695 [Leucobacter massiliensis]|uniref:Amidohydrolase-related domain-containing protein n=1 Tax=Leucobacter massiliensis TaxID=1686285 RepID=A0A2S9QNY5_9MICO|nr:hypothetical protein B4915_10695 [Leucobacter massiliensis]